MLDKYSTKLHFTSSRILKFPPKFCINWYILLATKRKTRDVNRKFQNPVKSSKNISLMALFLFFQSHYDHVKYFIELKLHVLQALIEEFNNTERGKKIVACWSNTGWKNYLRSNYLPFLTVATLFIRALEIQNLSFNILTSNINIRSPLQVT